MAVMRKEVGSSRWRASLKRVHSSLPRKHEKVKEENDKKKSEDEQASIGEAGDEVTRSRTIKRGRSREGRGR